MRITLDGESVDLTPDRPSAARPMRKPDIVLISCVKGKRAVAAEARDFYTSDYFVKMRRYAEATGVPWFILSAEHGLVAPTDWLKADERCFPKAPSEYRRIWGRRVGVQLERAAGPLSGKLVEVHAGAKYIEAIAPALEGLGAHLHDRLEGLSFGRRLSWYLGHEVQVGAR